MELPVIPVATVTFAALWPVFLGGLAIALLASGIDDLVPLLIFLLRKQAPSSSAASPNAGRERRIAIFVPCWRESAVIANMVRHNLAAIRYRHFDFFLGVYPNDPATVAVAKQLAGEFPNVNFAECPHPGPTSKADCLNWIYQRMLLLERERSISFDTVVLHDAEDMIHPRALSLIDRERAQFAMVQVPVLPLKTGFGDVTHGIYCDEFAEFQTIDMPARELSGAFVPSNGVGTGFARVVLDQLARERNGLVFDPASLTEDYEIGVYIHAAGYRQRFSPLEPDALDFVATREYFPRSVQTAIRQRTRWVTGIALQCWERHGWRGSWRTRYWFWRDRKGLITNPLSVLTNVLFVVGLLDYALSSSLDWPWIFEVKSPTMMALCTMTMILQCFRLALRAACVGRIFGVAAALGVPLRSFHANLINASATVLALKAYFQAKLKKRALAWQKTEHAYPTREALHVHRRELADVLLNSGYVSPEQISKAREELTAGSTLDLLLLSKGIVGEEEMWRAISLQSGLPAARVDTGKVNARVVRGLPALIERRHGLLPFDVQAGRLLVASAQIPSAEAIEEMKNLTDLPIELQLVTRSNYQELLRML